MNTTMVQLTHNKAMQLLQDLHNTYNDGDLVSLLQKGDEQTFRKLYNRYWKRPMAFAVLQLRSAEDAEELLQDIFLLRPGWIFEN